MELMVVVAIIGVSAAIAGPAITRAMAISRADRANHDMIRLVRFARSQSIAFGRAYLVHFETTGNGRAELWEGTTSACRRETWANVMAAGNCTAAGGMPSGNCVDYVDSTTYDTGMHHVAFASVGGLDICFQPNGDALTHLSTTPAAAFNVPITGIVTITTTRLENAVAPDPRRGVIMPLGGAPRALR